MKSHVLAMLWVLGLSVSASAQDKSAKSSADSASRPVTVCAVAVGTINVTSEILTDAITECQKRDTARLFLIAGKPNAALRLLCDTGSARVAFGDDYEAERHQWIHPAVPQKCLQALKEEQ